jgi:hypothetical protein
MTRHAVYAIAAVLLLEVGFFGYWNRDIVWLSRPVVVLAGDTSFPANARMALLRERLSRRVVERIAEVAERRSDHRLQLAALNRLAKDFPEESSLQVRRADVLRTLGRHAEAEDVFRGVLPGDAEAGGRP